MRACTTSSHTFSPSLSRSRSTRAVCVCMCQALKKFHVEINAEPAENLVGIFDWVRLQFVCFSHLHTTRECNVDSTTSTSQTARLSLMNAKKLQVNHLNAF